MSEEKFDNINRILKSISPLKNTFSKMSKKLDKTFKYASLNNLVKSLEERYIYRDQFEPDPEIILHKNDYNVNFQNSYEYLDELSNINNLPLVIQNKNCIKDGDFNPNFEGDINKNEINRKYLLEEEIKRKRERLKKRIDKLKQFKESDSNIDPGKYHPNYNAIKRRCPCAFIRDPNSHIKDSWLINCPFRNTFEDFKRLENEKKENLKKENSKDEKDKNIQKNPNNDNNNSTILSKKNLNNNSNGKEGKDMNIPSTNLFSNENSPSSLSLNEVNKENNEENLELNEKNRKIKNANSEKVKNFSLPMIATSPRNQNSSIISSNISYSSKIISPKKKINRSISYENLLETKSPILFKKMRGRTNLFNESKYLISYEPNYDSTFPHVPSYIFKYKKNKQNYKKYINGKIIRGYYYNPSEYYVMELQKAEEKK